MSGFEDIAWGEARLKMWTKGVPVEHRAIQQMMQVAQLPFIHRHVAAMPDMHVGRGATVGSVIAARGAVIPAAVGVDIGCGMMAVRLSLTADRFAEQPEGGARGHRTHGAAWPAQGWRLAPARGAEPGDPSLAKLRFGIAADGVGGAASGFA